MASGINLKKAQLAYNNVNKDIKNLETQLANFRKAVAEMNANIWYGGNSANKWYESANAAYKKDCKFLDSLYNIQSKLANKIDSTLAASGSTGKLSKAGSASRSGAGSSNKSITITDSDLPVRTDLPRDKVATIESAFIDYKTGKISQTEYMQIYDDTLAGTPLLGISDTEQIKFRNVKNNFGLSKKDSQTLDNIFILRNRYGVLSQSEYEIKRNNILDKYKPDNISEKQWEEIRTACLKYSNGKLSEEEYKQICNKIYQY